MGSTALADLVSRLPDRPGCYVFKDVRSEVIYVGKARSLRHRVASYFQPGRAAHARTDAMVSHVADLEFIATDTEMEALVLENTLIKENRPRYNVVLRDDKNFPYLRLSRSEPYPRLSIVRRPRKGKDAYFGPYIPAAEARRMVRLVHKEFLLRSCREDLDGRRDRPCLYYQIGQCLAPCVENICSREEYLEAVSEAELFLEGRNRELGERLDARMRAAAEAERYEEAARYRDMLRMLGKLGETQKASTTDLSEQDVFGFHRDGRRAVAHVLVKRAGLLRRREELPFDGGEGLLDDECLSAMMQQYYERTRDVAREVLVPFPPSDLEVVRAWLEGLRGGPVHLHAPVRGEKRRFVRMAMDNALLAELSRRAQDPAAALEELKNVLALPALPLRIEGFDNSNIQGSDPVSALVVFQDGRPNKAEYRRFGIKTVVGSDDLATMREVVGRRYRRVKEEDGPRPDLILIAGGKGQVAAARAALFDLGLDGLPVVGLAKREELLVLPDRDEAVSLPRDSEALKLLMRVRDEAHRFAVAFHRQRRSRSRLVSELGRIPGLGPSRTRRLLRALGSVEGITKASEADIATLLGPALARRVWQAIGAR